MVTHSVKADLPLTHSAPAPVSFASLGVPAVLAESLETAGLSSAFPIQTATLPDTLAGRDVLGRGRTGSGKTLAFAIPLVARLAGLVSSGARLPHVRRQGSPRGLVLAPTRELANQILATVEPLAVAAGLKVMTVFGGVSQAGQVRQLRRGIDIVVATPGRLEDLMAQGEVRLDDVAVTVLDEADHMADLGFLPGVTRILAATPAGGQRLLFSATLDAGVDKLVARFLHHQLVHSVDSESSPVAAMVHHVLMVADPAQKARVVRELASGRGRRLLFTRTKHQARKLARELTGGGIPAVELHGNLSQNARERGLKAFADGDVRVMVATDIAARGIHVDEVELVVHVDPPAEHKAYLHRSGRTARAGHDGDVVTLVLPEQRKDFQVLSRAARISATPTPVSVHDPLLQDLVGRRADPVAPQDAPAAAARRGEPAPTPAGRSRSRQAASGRDGRATAPTTKTGGRAGAQGKKTVGRADARGTAPARPGRPVSLVGGGTSSGRGAADFSARQGRRRGGSRRAA